MLENKELKIHLGCGKRNIPGFVHVDIDNHPHIDYIHKINDLPMFANNSADFIYSCHNFEYFDRDEAINVLKEWNRVLKSNGILRMAVPNFEAIVQVYLKYKDLDHKGILGPLYGKWQVQNNKEVSFIYHKTVYDFQSLKKNLENAGFINVRKYNPKEVFPEDYDDHSMAYIPHMDKNGILVSLNIECEKA